MVHLRGAARSTEQLLVTGEHAATQEPLHQHRAERERERGEGGRDTHLQGPHQSVCWLRPKRARHFLGEPGSEHNATCREREREREREESERERERERERGEERGKVSIVERKRREGEGEREWGGGEGERRGGQGNAVT